ncbi:MAG: FG-GAP repeat protein, partial [Planctomycetes bacterium]|nr:FG-GAP repeat protein [Planctomycetota bacterium]
MRFAMMMTIGVLAGSAHAQPSTAGPGEPGWVRGHQKISNTAAASADLGDQLFKLLPNDGAADDRFGWSVAISGATAIVGAYVDDDNGNQSGSAYLFNTTT